MPEPIRFLKRKNCPLCEQALQVLNRLCSRRGLSFETIDIDLTSGFESYEEDIPVLLIGEDKALQHHFSEQQLDRILDRVHRP
ncbi:MAG: glutaredoxin family protein [Acidobacteria bacterium]|nr:glutaredoxin family protein [Acidobacteriota bacterium]